MYYYDSLQPILDKRENNLLAELTDQYKKLMEPGIFTKCSEQIGDFISIITPDKAKEIVSDVAQIALDNKAIQTTIEHAGKGVQKLIETTSEYTHNKEKIVRDLKVGDDDIECFDHICRMRSYSIEKICNQKKFTNLLFAFGEGGVTGFAGFAGLPFNIVLSLFLYFRVCQLIGLHYGYDIIDDPRELEIASNVAITCFSPNTEDSVENLTGLIGKMMLAAEITTLRNVSATLKMYQKLAKK